MDVCNGVTNGRAGCGGGHVSYSQAAECSVVTWSRGQCRRRLRAVGGEFSYMDRNITHPSGIAVFVGTSALSLQAPCTASNATRWLSSPPPLRLTPSPPPRGHGRVPPPPLILITPAARARHSTQGAGTVASAACTCHAGVGTGRRLSQARASHTPLLTCASSTAGNAAQDFSLPRRGATDPIAAQGVREGRGGRPQGAGSVNHQTPAQYTPPTFTLPPPPYTPFSSTIFIFLFFYQHRTSAAPHPSSA